MKPEDRFPQSGARLCRNRRGGGCGHNSCAMIESSSSLRRAPQILPAIAARDGTRRSTPGSIRDADENARAGAARRQRRRRLQRATQDHPTPVANARPTTAAPSIPAAASKVVIGSRTGVVCVNGAAGTSIGSKVDAICCTAAVGNDSRYARRYPAAHRHQ